MSTASTTGVTVGGILVAVVIGSLVYIAWKKRSLLGVAPPLPEPEAIEIREMPRPSPASVNPRLERNVPAIVVQSPSTPGEPGSSPLMSRSQSPT